VSSVDVPLRVVVLGAGSVGCYLGGLLVGRVREVVMIGRQGLADEVQTLGGLTLSDYRGRREVVGADRFRFVTDASEMAGADVIVVAVKGTATEEAGELIARYGAPAMTVISMQNGVRNAQLLRERVGERPVLAGMVSFNILREEGARFHMATSGPLVYDRSVGPAHLLVRAWSGAGLQVVEHDNMPGVQWSKLLFNLNNALAALSGLPLRDELSDREFRRLLADSMTEGLAVMAAEGIPPVRLGKMMPRIARRLLPLPNVLFKRLAGAMVKIDPKARSSMWDDLSRGRPTEIDLLQGEVVALGERHGVPTPVNRAVAALVKEAEAAEKGPPGLTAAQIRHRVTTGS